MTPTHLPQDALDAFTSMISFPARFRVRCPRCSAARQAPKNTGEPGHYLCESTDEFQSEACISRAKARADESLVADTHDILKKLGFGPVARGLRVVC